MKPRGALLIVCLQLALVALAQPPDATTVNKLVLTLQNPPRKVASASVQRIGNPGPRTLFYWIVTSTDIGSSSPSGPFPLSFAPGDLSTSTVNISWTPAIGAKRYDVLRTSTPVAPSGACNCAVATGVITTATSDQSESLQPYTVNSLDPASLAVMLTNQSGAMSVNSLAVSNTITERPLEPVREALASGQSAALGVIGDSTGVGTTRWPYLVSQWVGSQHPEYTVDVLAWNPTIQAFDKARLQTGTAGERYVQLPATGGGDVQLMPSEIPATAGDLDIRAKIAPDSWRPSTTYNIMSRFGASGARAFRFSLLLTTGNLYYQSSADGSTLSGDMVSSVAVPDQGANNPLWVRVTHQVDDGAAHNVVRFYTSTDGVTWTQLGVTITNTGATSIYTGAGIASKRWEIGGRGDGSGDIFHGRIYSATIYNGIPGTSASWVPAGPQQIDAWYANDGSTPFGGAPTFTMVNASQSGGDLVYWINSGDPSRFPKSVINYGQLSTIVNLGHNLSYNTGPWVISNTNNPISYASLAALVKAQLPTSSLVFTIQNPSQAPRTLTREHMLRQVQLASWARLNSYGTIDVMGAFFRDSRGLSVLLNTDGVHPSDAAGSPLWASLITSALAGGL